jgi:hypothetical protein
MKAHLASAGHSTKHWELRGALLAAATGDASDSGVAVGVAPAHAARTAALPPCRGVPQDVN